MATYDLEEQEKLIQLKDWWKRHGGLVLTTITLALVVIAGVRYWSQYKVNQAGEASVVYGEVLQAAETGDVKKVADLSGTLLEQYPRTIYASLGALISAKVHFEKGDPKTAQAQLQWVSEKGRDEAMQALGRVRLVQVQIDQKAYDDALKTLEGKHPAAFESRFVELRGDVYVAQGKKAEARSAYQSALALIPEKEKLARELLQFKLDALGTAA